MNGEPPLVPIRSVSSARRLLSGEVAPLFGVYWVIFCVWEVGL